MIKAREKALEAALRMGNIFNADALLREARKIEAYLSGRDMRPPKAEVEQARPTEPDYDHGKHWAA